MKALSLVIVSALAFVGTAGLAANSAAFSPVLTQQEEQKVLLGTVKSVDTEGKTFVVTGADKKDMTIRCDDKTVYMLDGKIAKMDEVVKVANNVTVTHKGGLASKVEANTKK